MLLQLLQVLHLSPPEPDIKKLEPGEFIYYVRRNGEIYDWDDETAKLPLIPVLHHGAKGGGMRKSRFCYSYLKERFRKVGGDCSFAHVWKERVEYICPICRESGPLECTKKCQHTDDCKKYAVVLTIKWLPRFQKSEYYEGRS